MTETLGERVLARLTQTEREARFPTPGELAAYCTKGQEWTAPHLDLIDRVYLAIAEGKLKRVLITMPPRHGKTRRMSHWGPAWYLHRFPERRVMLTSYEADFAASHGRAVRDIIAGNDLGITLSQNSTAAARWDLAGHAGGMVTAGMGGRLTGLGAHLLGIDDPVKDAAEAHSQTIRDSHWEWFLSTALTRLEPGGAAFVLMTRWHDDDLGGRIQREQAKQWTVINLPAIAEESDPLEREPGEALWPERYPIDELERIRETQGSYWWSAMYMGRPTPAAGGLFKKDWLRYFTATPQGYVLDNTLYRPKQGWAFATVDLAASTKTSADWTVVCSWFVTYDGHLLLLDMERERVEESGHWPLIQRQHAKHRLAFVSVESRVFGSTLVYEMGRKGVHFRELKADTDKVTRAIPATVRMESGHTWLPAGASFLPVVEGELLGFPNARFDDVVDCFSYAAAQLARFGHGRAPKVHRPPGTLEEQFWAAQKADLDGERNQKYVGLA